MQARSEFQTDVSFRPTVFVGTTSDTGNSNTHVIRQVTFMGWHKTVVMTVAAVFNTFSDCTEPFRAFVDRTDISVITIQGIVDMHAARLSLAFIIRTDILVVTFLGRRWFRTSPVRQTVNIIKPRQSGAMSLMADNRRVGDV